MLADFESRSLALRENERYVALAVHVSADVEGRPAGVFAAPSARLRKTESLAS